MDKFFIDLINASINASWLILAVIALRLVLGKLKVPKSYQCILWILVAVRLICPVSIESNLSLIPSAETIPYEILYARSPAIQSGIPAVNNIVNPVLSETSAPKELTSVNPLQIYVYVCTRIWAFGALALLFFAIVSYLRIRRRVAIAIRMDDKSDIWQSEFVDTPFILGIFRPRIYLPFHMDPRQQTCVIAHERAHLRRKDHWWKPLAFLLLAVHWFNPLMWVAYIMFCQDIELACDEHVIRSMSADDKKVYSQTLLAFSISKSFVLTCPLAFGEIGVKERIGKIIKYRKPALWMAVIAAIAVVSLTACFMTSPKSEKQESENMAEISTEFQTESTAEITSKALESESGAWDADTDQPMTGTPLTEEEIAWFNERFTPIFMDKQGNSIGLNPLTCFIMSYYDSIENMDFTGFLAYFPNGTDLTDETEFEALKQVDGWKFGADVTLETMPVPIHKYTTDAINTILKGYAGITVNDLKTIDSLTGVLYLPEYDSYYNFTSDAGFGIFRCTFGEKDGDIVKLYQENGQNTDVLTLRKVQENIYHIVSFQPR